MMENPVNIAVVGLGRIGEFHALHANEVARTTRGCRLAALVDTDVDKAERLREALGSDARVFAAPEGLIEAEVANASVVATPTALHRRHAAALTAAGQRVLLEKPMTEGLEADRDFVDHLGRSTPKALVLAFQRRFDRPLLRSREIVQSARIGRVFKAVSILEDSAPPPLGFDSPGMFEDMAVHNVDEVMWLLDAVPHSAVSIGNRLYGHRASGAGEDFDDGLIYLWFPGEAAGEVHVSRNHVSGYRTETWVFGEEGFVHVGNFDSNKREIAVEAYGRSEVLAREVYRMRDYGRPVPEFVDRFGPAYKAELEHFIGCCLAGSPFGVDQYDGLAAMEVIDAAAGAAIMAESRGSVAPLTRR